ncbi:MAG: cyclodeaminase/cyclohydrolase family protein [Candidatus Heimdallarchaeota archaeon]|nr:MAG: cyclodeaminase/cyclohydrolase family protein [Candidatus Heimdallarchaeota archaeon]
MNDTRLMDLTVSKFVEEVASDKPAPGGGSVSALGGTLATALAVLVGKATFGKEKFADVQDEMEVVISKGTEFTESLIKLVDEDTEAFNQVLSAYRMPRDESEARSYAIQAALKRAAEVPLKVAKTSFKALDLILTAADKGNKNAITDAGVAALFAESAVRGALFNVKINLLSIKDEEVKAHFTREIKEILERLDSKKEAIIKIVEAEIGG